MVTVEESASLRNFVLSRTGKYASRTLQKDNTSSISCKLGYMAWNGTDGASKADLQRT